MMLNGWGELPTVVLLDVYEYLSAKDRLNASSACANWRNPVFQIPLCDSLNLDLTHFDKDEEKVKFLAYNLVHKVSNVNLKFDPVNPNAIALASEVLEILAGTGGLKSLRIQYAEETLSSKVLYGKTTSDLVIREYFIRKVIRPLLKVLQAKNCLETFSIQLPQELMKFQNIIHSTLANSRKAYTLRKLFLSTLRNPLLFKHNNLALIPSVNSLEFFGVNQYLNLQKLNIEYEVLSDNILSSVGAGNLSGGLKMLHLIATKNNEHVSNAGWTWFIKNNRECKVRLTVMGSGVSMDHRSNLIFPSIPISHFKALYCKDIKISAMNSLVSWNENTLEHLELVNENCDWFCSVDQDELDQFIDPIIYAAWRCKLLSTIKIRFLYCGENLVGIARLKGSNLTCLEVPESQLMYSNKNMLSNEVSKALNRMWMPIKDTENQQYRNMQYKVASTARSLILNEN